MRTMKRFLALFSVTTLFMIAFAASLYADTEQAPVRDGDDYLGRTYNADFDRNFDNFERSTVSGIDGTDLDWATTDDTDTFITDYHLEVPYTHENPTDPDAAIYKVGTPTNADGQFNYLVFEMAGREGASIDDLVLSFRYDDNHTLVHVPFDELLDPDYQAMPELTEEYQIYVIDLLGSLAEEEFEHFDTEDTIQAGNVLQGLHLHQDDESAGEGILMIDKVYWTNEVNPDYTDTPAYQRIDFFEREAVDAGDDHIWWRDSIGMIIGKHLSLDGTTDVATYEAKGTANTDGAYDNVVFRARGLHGGEDIRITPLYDNGDVTYGDSVLLSEATGPDEELLPGMSTSFTGFVLNFAENGWDNEVAGFKVETLDGEPDTVYIDHIFFTNMEYEPDVVAEHYPVLDPDDILVFDNFERDELGATPGYDPNNPIALDHGFQFIIAYAGIAYMSIEDDALVMDAEATDGHMQYTASSQARMNDGAYEYVVFRIKGENAASLNEFRFQSIDGEGNRSPVYWGHSELYSAPGLQTPHFGDDYPYIADDDYMYLIVDIAETGLTETIAGFDLFYSGEGQIHIDAIFYANGAERELDMENRMVFEDFDRETIEPDGHWWHDAHNALIEDSALVLDATGGQHAAYRTAAPDNNADAQKPYFYLRMKADEGTTLESFRLYMVDLETERFFNANHLIDWEGEVLSDVTDEYEYYVIDLEASELLVAALGYGLFFGDWDEGRLHIDETGFVDIKDFMAPLEETLAAVDIYSPVAFLTAVDIHGDAQDVKVPTGMDEADALDLLAAEITIEDDAGDTHVVAVDWTITDYDGDAIDDYAATGTFELPEGVIADDESPPLEVAAVVRVLPTLSVVDVEEAVGDIEVDHGTSEADAIALLPETVDLEDSEGDTHEVDVTWTIADYDGDTEGDYIATGVFELPENIHPDHDLDEMFEVTVTVLPDTGIAAWLVTVLAVAVLVAAGGVVYFIRFRK